VKVFGLLLVAAAAWIYLNQQQAVTEAQQKFLTNHPGGKLPFKPGTKTKEGGYVWDLKI
jgi:hypothetical protein